MDLTLLASTLAHKGHQANQQQLKHDWWTLTFALASDDLQLRVTALCAEKLAAGTEGPSVRCALRLARSSGTIRIAFFILLHMQKL